MKPYYGSNTIIEQIDLSRCKPYKDFRQGFYLAEIREQVEQMVNIIFSYLIDNKIVIISFTKIGNGLETSEIQPIVLFCIHSKNKAILQAFTIPKYRSRESAFTFPPNYNLPSVR